MLAGNCEYLPAQLMGRRYTDVGDAIEVVQELKRALAKVPGLAKENKDLTKDASPLHNRPFHAFSQVFSLRGCV